jgi:hypothetical protein
MNMPLGSTSAARLPNATTMQVGPRVAEFAFAMVEIISEYAFMVS